MPTVLESLNAALHRALHSDARVYILGEDLLDPYGGAFKVTRGLSTAFPGRVLATPVSEAGIVGLAAGMALRGLRPVVEIMFGDFVTLIADQLINHAAKYRWMYNNQVSVPLVIRTPMGGRRGYGPTHSQTLEKIYLGIPGLRVIAPSSFGSPGDVLLQTIMEGDDPALFIENKLLYSLPVRDPSSMEDFELVPEELKPLKGETDRVCQSRSPLLAAPQLPSYTLRLRGAPGPALTLLAYGYMAELCYLAAQRLAYEHEVLVELVIPSQLAPFHLEPVLASLRRTRHLLVVEEGTQTMGWGAEILARAAEEPACSGSRMRRLGSRDQPIPASPKQENSVLPGVEEIVQAAKKMV